MIAAKIGQTCPAIRRIATFKASPCASFHALSGIIPGCGSTEDDQYIVRIS
jgi:hypothetical protein